MRNVLSPRDLVSRPDNMDETVLSSSSTPIVRGITSSPCDRLFSLLSFFQYFVNLREGLFEETSVYQVLKGVR